MGERLLLADFEPHVGTSFRLSAESIDIDVVLVSGEELISGPEAHLPDVSFSLLFRGPLEHKLPQMTRRLGHPELGDLEIFLTPVSEDEDGRYYEAVFNYVD